MKSFEHYLQLKVIEWRNNGYQGIYPETKNILAHIDGNNFLHQPQREAFETFIYLKEILDNKSVPEILFEFINDDQSMLSDLGFEETIVELWNDLPEVKRLETLGKKLENLGFVDYGYANYVLALTMGSGKTILMGVLIMYEFILSYNHPQDDRFAKNALVFGPADTGIIEVLKEIKTFDYGLVIPNEYEDVLLNVKYWYLEKPETPLNPLGNYNIIVSNSSKIIIRNFSKSHKGNRLFELRKESVNERLMAIQGLENLSVYVDEAHHSYGKDIAKSLNQSRKTIQHLSNNTNVVTVANLTGTPYVNNTMLPDTVYTFGLQKGIEKGILKQVIVSNHGSVAEVQSQDFVNSVIKAFWAEYGENRLEGRLPKIAIYTSDISVLEQLEKNLDKALMSLKIPLHKKLVWHSTFTGKKKRDADFEFNRLDTPESDKQFVLLVNKGTEGWNCKSLVAVALYKNSTSNNFVLQSSCRCLRRIGDNSTKARVFLSNENYNVLNKELEANFNTNILQLSGKSQNEVQVDLVVEKKRTVKVTRQITEIISSEKADLEQIKLSLKLAPKKLEELIVQEREITLNKDGKAIYKDPVSIKSEKTSEHLRTFGYYNIASIIQRRTHLKFSEINRLFEVNEITRKQLVQAVESNYLVIDSIIDQILDQGIQYEKNVYTKEEELELTKSFPFKINVKRELGENEEEAFARSLVVYREKSEENGQTSQLGFHVNPYNFDSTDELEMFNYLRANLKDGELVKDVYFTGGITNNKHNEFYFDYQENLDERTNKLSKYFPDFLIETSLGRHLVLEVKTEQEKLTYDNEKKRLENNELNKNTITSNPLMKELGFREFQELNNKFEYHIIFNGKVVPHQQKVVDLVESLNS